MKLKIIILTLILGFSISGNSFAYEPSGILQCLKKTESNSSLQSFTHKTAILNYEGEPKCKSISGNFDNDCRSTFKRHIIDKGRECGHKGTDKEVYDTYKVRANKIYGFRGGFEISGRKNGNNIFKKLPCTGVAISKNVVIAATNCFRKSLSVFGALKSNYGKYFEYIKPNKLYFHYHDKKNQLKRVQLIIPKIKTNKPYKHDIILFETNKNIEREYYIKIAPRGDKLQTIEKILSNNKFTETTPISQPDWIKKFGERGRRKIYAKCPIGFIDNFSKPNKYIHKCDIDNGFSGAPIFTSIKSICKEEIKTPILIAIDLGFNDKKSGNTAALISGAILEEIYRFIDNTRDKSAASVKQPKQKSRLKNLDKAELVFWQTVKDTKDPDELKAYLEAYPEGKFSTLAKLRMKRLK